MICHMSYNVHYKYLVIGWISHSLMYGISYIFNLRSP